MVTLLYRHLTCGAQAGYMFNYSANIILVVNTAQSVTKRLCIGL